MSDVLTNAFTVIKCVKQASRQLVSYHETTTAILRADGVRGLVGRGLSTRLFGSGVQGMVRLHLSSLRGKTCRQREAGMAQAHVPERVKYWKHACL